MTGSRPWGLGREDGGLQKELTPFEAVVLWLGVKRQDASGAGGPDGAKRRGGLEVGVGLRDTEAGEGSSLEENKEAEG